MQRGGAAQAGSLAGSVRAKGREYQRDGPAMRAGRLARKQEKHLGKE